MKCKTVKLGDYLYIKGRIGWKGLKKSEYLDAGEFRIINGETLTEDGINWEKAGYITQERYDESPEIMLQEEDILISKDGTIGKIGYVDKLESPTTVASGIFLIRNEQPDILDTRFVYYFLRSPYFRAFIEMRTEGSVIPHLYQKDFVDLDFPLFDIDVQRKVASLLNTLDEKISLNKKINDNLQQQALTLYSSMFCSTTNINTTPGILSDIANITMGQSPSSDSYNEEGIGEVFYQGRAEFGFRFPTRRLYTTEPKRMAEVGDILLSVRAPVGDFNIAYERCCIGRGLGALRSKDGNSSFLLYTIFSIKPQLDVFNGEGTVFGSINREALNNISIAIPSADEIAYFENTVRPMDDLIKSNYEEICRLQAIRDSLLPKLMSGKIDVSKIDL